MPSSFDNTRPISLDRDPDMIEWYDLAAFEREVMRRTGADGTDVREAHITVLQVMMYDVQKHARSKFALKVWDREDRWRASDEPSPAAPDATGLGCESEREPGSAKLSEGDQ
jgi:hypothetical protein